MVARSCRCDACVARRAHARASLSVGCVAAAWACAPSASPLAAVLRHPLPPTHPPTHPHTHTPHTTHFHCRLERALVRLPCVIRVPRALFWGEMGQHMLDVHTPLRLPSTQMVV